MYKSLLLHSFFTLAKFTVKAFLGCFARLHATRTDVRPSGCVLTIILLGCVWLQSCFSSVRLMSGSRTKKVLRFSMVVYRSIQAQYMTFLLVRCNAHFTVKIMPVRASFPDGFLRVLLFWNLSCEFLPNLNPTWFCQISFCEIQTDLSSRPNPATTTFTNSLGGGACENFDCIAVSSLRPNRGQWSLTDPRMMQQFNGDCCRWLNKYQLTLVKVCECDLHACRTCSSGCLRWCS